MYRKVVAWVRSTWDRRLVLWLDIILSRKLFVLAIPTNFNYWRSKKSIARIGASGTLITIADVGSRGAPPPEFDQIRPFSRYFGFDASDSAQEHSVSHSRDWSSYEVFQMYIGGLDEMVEFNNFADGGLSSSYEPNPDYVAEFAPKTKVESKEVLKSETLGSALGNEIHSVDFLKLDTQGSELGILKSEKVCDIPLIEVEVEFIEVYTGQPLFGEIHSHMIDNGYRLLWLTRHVGSPHNAKRYGRGSLVFGEALFGLSTGRACQLPLGRFQNYIRLLSIYGHVDFAEYLLDRRTDMSDDLKIEMESMIDAIVPRKGSLNDGSLMSSLLEKTQFLMGVGMGRHNRYQTDSDRSMFFR